MKKKEDKREQRGDLYDNIQGGLRIQFLTPPNRAKLKWCYYKQSLPRVKARYVFLVYVVILYGTNQK